MVTVGGCSCLLPWVYSMDRTYQSCLCETKKLGQTSDSFGFTKTTWIDSMHTIDPQQPTVIPKRKHENV